MIPLSRAIALLVVGVIGLVAVPMAFVGSDSTLTNIAIVAPVLILVEIMLYFILSLAMNPRLTLGASLFLALMMGALRCVASLVGLSLLSLFTMRDASFMAAWAGDPISVILQVIILIVVTPHLLDAASPELVDRETRRKLLGAEPQAVASAPARTGHHADTSPSGGFIQVFGYEELSATIRKTQGLEGFLIFSNEGLIVWRDLPMRVDVDVLTARLMSIASETGTLTDRSGLARMRQVVVETREHLVAVVELNANFGMILFYNAQTNLADHGQRMAVLAKTAREFLQWKYPGLAVTSAPQSRTALEAVS